MFYPSLCLDEGADKARHLREPGQTNVEYALILFFLAGATVMAFSMVGQRVQSALDCMNAAFAGRC
jgi:Flp pilus assembly pilin Flp